MKFSDIEIVKYLSKLQKQNIEVYSSAGKLHILDEDKLMTDEIITKLKDNKAQIIRILQQHTVDDKKFDFVVRGKYIPLSFAQERLWFMDQYMHNASYNIPDAIRLFGEINIEALKKTLLEIVNRHEALRTNFVTINEEPKQIIHENPTWNLEIVSLNHLSKEEADKRILTSIFEEIQKPFDLEKDRLIRFVIYTVEEDELVLFMNLHHIISDAWSASILINEITVIYEAFSKNLPSPLKELPIQYADYAIWQRAYLEGDLLQRQADYWKGKLQGVEILELATDKVRPKEQTFNGSTLQFHLNKDLTNNLQKLTRAHGATLFMTLLAAFKILLHKYTGRTDICVGSPIANRTREEVEGLIGFFVNSLVLRSNVNPELSFNDFLAQVKTTLLEAYENQDIPFEKVVEILEPERNLSYSPLVQVMLVLQNTPMEKQNSSSLNIEHVGIQSTVSKFDYTIYITETSNGLYGSIEYNTDLFEESTMARMAKHFEVLIDQIVSNSQKPIKELGLLTHGEKQQLLVDWNDTNVDYPNEKSIHQLFEDQATKIPNNVAVVFGENTLTYRQLNERSNQLAHYLKKKGIKKESLVGICMHRSLDMIVSILGTLKAGGAYVPIDPKYPEDRISYMLEDASCEIVITQEGTEIPKNNSEIIYLDLDWQKIEAESIENLKSEVGSDNLVYVMYTSGSTGRPKGVMVEHGNVTRLVMNNNYVPLNTSTVLLSTGSISFDATSFEFWGPLLNGGRLVLCPETTLLDGQLLQGLIAENGVNTMWFTSGLLNLFVDTELDLFSDLSYVIAGGDKLSKYHIGKLYNAYPKLVLYNGYGPTENTTFSICHRITELDLSKASIPIGSPIANSTVYILGNHNELQPIGIVGEICLGGAGLSRGYLNNDDLTSEKFITHPHETGERLYKTGDFGRWLSDGTIEFVGRIDDQIKLRGYRIEIGEIESVVQEHSESDVSSCIVLVKELTNGDKELVCYLVGESIDIEKLRNYLMGVLPAYMIPSYFMELDAIPLNSNGKVDKISLPDPDGTSITLGTDYIGPRNEAEKKLVAIWSEVLGISESYISVNSNFFELGGNSFKIIRLLKRINKVFGYDLKVVVLFRYPTIALFSNSIDANDSLEEMESLLDDAVDVFNENIALMNNNENG